jgi:hypothetical protein
MSVKKEMEKNKEIQDRGYFDSIDRYQIDWIVRQIEIQRNTHNSFDCDPEEFEGVLDSL